jgi:hypothetical protein
MARKRRTKRRRVSAPRRTKRRKRSIGLSPSVIGSPRRRKRRRHSVGRKGRRRIGAHSRGGSGGQSTLGEFAGLTLGVGTGLFVATLGWKAINGPNTSPGNILMGAALKAVAGGALFYVGKKHMGNNAFVKGTGIGFEGSAINDGFNYMQSTGMISGPKMMNIELKDPSAQQRFLYPRGGANVNGGPSPSVIGDKVHEAVPMYDNGMPLNY